MRTWAAPGFLPASPPKIEETTLPKPAFVGICWAMSLPYLAPSVTAAEDVSGSS